MAAQLSLVEGGKEEEQQGGFADPVLEVFEFWKALMEKPRSQLGPERRKKIENMLRLKYSVDDLRLAIVGCKYDNWSQGQNDRSRKFDDIELICRDEVRLDRFIELGEEYMKRVERKEKESAEREQKGVPMPASSRARLDAMFKKYRRPA